MRPAKPTVMWYFALVMVLTLPIWLLSSGIEIELLPGLPIAAVAIVCPALAAVLLVVRTDGREGVVALLGRTVDFRRGGWRVVGVAAVNPILFGGAWVATRTLGTSIPVPTFGVAQAMVLFAVFLPTALLEEIGWTGYALPGLQSRHGPVTSGAIIGLFWAAWHVPALVQVGRQVDWILWWTLWTVAARILMVLVHDWTGKSVFAVALYHAISNLCWQLYPVEGSYFDPAISGMVTLAAVAVLLILRAAGRHQ